VLIDGFTVVAEIANFLILIVLLQKVLYKPLLKVMDAREQKIASALAAAAEKQRQADAEAEHFRQARHELDGQRDAVLAQARSDAEAYRRERLESARQETAETQARWRADIARQQQSFLHDLRQLTAHEVVRVSSRVLGHLAGADLERQAIEAFIEHIKRLDGDDLKTMQQFAQVSGQTIQARSAFEMPDEARRQLIQALRQQLGEEIGVHFEVVPDLGFGIELKADGHKLAWNLESYLEGLEDSVAAALNAQTDEMGAGAAGG
jgi:F-type H+-transporting ATPase subunit b